MEDEAAARLDRSAELHRHRFDRLRQSYAVFRWSEVEPFQQFAEGQHWCALVDDDSHGAAFGMGAQENEGSFETRIAHAGHGDEHLAVKERRLFHGQSLFWR